MGRYILPLVGLLVFLSACTNRPVDGGPQLVQEITLIATTPSPTRVISPTPSFIPIPTVASPLISPLEVPTLETDIDLTTPTLQPSRTQTLTPTITNTPSRTPTPVTPFIFIASPPGGIAPIPTAVTAGQSPATCPILWFFASPGLPTCPLSTPLIGSGATQTFQGGFMLWVQQQDAIYVLYTGAATPQWQVYNDTFADGMPDTDPAYNNPPPGTYQPRRGFGLLWRTAAEVRNRLGWAIVDSETAYNPQLQIASDGTIYISESSGAVLSLAPGGSSWVRFG